MRDLLMVYRLQREAVPLCAEAWLAARAAPLQLAVHQLLVADGAPVETRVLRKHAGGRSGFVQLRLRPPRREVDLLFIAPALREDGVDALWEELLAGVAAWAAQRQVLRVYAAVPLDGPEEVLFRRVGYQRYAAERIYQLRGELKSNGGQARDEGLSVRPERQRDAWGLRQLHAAGTPLRVQQAEGFANGGAAGRFWQRQVWGRAQGFVCEQGDLLHGHAVLCQGAAGYWLRLMVRGEQPAVVRALLAGALAEVSAPKQVYCAVRHYEPASISAALLECGFEVAGENALLVRHLALQVRPALEELTSRLQGLAGASYNRTLRDDGEVSPCQPAWHRHGCGPIL